MKFYLKRYYLDKQGYSKTSGQYFGIGEPLYRATEDDTELPLSQWPRDIIFRAKNREEAKKYVKEYYSNQEVTFFK